MFYKNKQAYTLIELLVVMAILTITVTSALAFLTATLQGSNQANIIAEVKQNGQVVLDSMEKQIRNATGVVQLTSQLTTIGASNGILVNKSDGRLLYLACFNSTASTNGWIGVVETSPGASVPTGAEFRALTNKDPRSGIDIANYANGTPPTGCAFQVIVSTQSLGAPVVYITFTGNQGVLAPTRADFAANVSFQTTIALRRY